MIRSFWRFSKINLAVLALLVVFLIGIFGYRWVEDFSYMEALYMTVITISTVGFGELHTLSDEGRMFTVFLIISSFGIFAYTLSAISSYIFTGEFRGYFKEKKLNNTIKKLENHVIICGYGRNGHRAAQEFRAHKTSFAVIELNQTTVDTHKDDVDFLMIQGDSREDEVLVKAKIDKARALISALPDDADNLLTVLTARELNKDLLIISRASGDNTYHKLKLAGANNVIMPDKIGGAHMASLVLKPDIMEFFDQILTQNPDAPYLKEVNCSDLSMDKESYTIGKLKEINERGVTIIGAKTSDGDYLVNPPDDYMLSPTSKLFVLGTTSQIAAFKR